MGDSVVDFLLANDNFSTFHVLNSSEEFRTWRLMDYLEHQLGPRRSSFGILIAMCVFYIGIFFTGVVGNTVTIWVISKNPRMHTGGTNYYLINLAISDLISLILGLPFEIYTLFEEYPYPFGEHFCQARAWVSEAATLSSILTILAFTVERYVAICHPFKNIHFRTKNSRVILTIVVSWVMAFTAAGPMGFEFTIIRAEYPPELLGYKTIETIFIDESAVCTPKTDGPMVILIQFSTFVFFFLPMLLIIFLHIVIGIHLRRSSYLTRESLTSDWGSQPNTNGHLQQSSYARSQGRQSVLRMLVAVALAFFVCYAPHHAQRLHAVYEKNWDNTNMLIHRSLTFVSGVFYYGASTVNPFLYSILSARFRKAYRSTLCFCFNPRADLHREQFSGHSLNSQACSLRYRPSSTSDNFHFSTSRQNSLVEKNGITRLHTANGHSVSMNLLWSSPKFLVPVRSPKEAVATVFYSKKKRRKASKAKKKTVAVKPKNNTKTTDEDNSSISGSSLQEREFAPDLELVSDFVNGGTNCRISIPRFIINPPSDEGSANTDT